MSLLIAGFVVLRDDPSIREICGATKATCEATDQEVIGEMDGIINL